MENLKYLIYVNEEGKEKLEATKVESPLKNLGVDDGGAALNRALDRYARRAVAMIA